MFEFDPYKYVTVSFNYGDIVIERIFIFPMEINHNDFFETLKHSRIRPNWRDWELINPTLLGAGFTDLRVCYGRSETLNCNSRHEDTLLLLRGTGIEPPQPTVPAKEALVTKVKSQMEKNALDELKIKKNKKRSSKKLRGY